MLFSISGSKLWLLCLALKPCTACEASVDNLTACSMACECEDKSGKSSLVPFDNDSRSSDSQKSFIIGGSKMPHNVKSIVSNVWH